jgi:hypothetical protein
VYRQSQNEDSPKFDGITQRKTVGCYDDGTTEVLYHSLGVVSEECVL